MGELPQNSSDRIHNAIRQYLESLQRSGIRQLPRLPDVAPSLASLAAQQPAQQPAHAASAVPEAASTQAVRAASSIDRTATAARADEPVPRFRRETITEPVHTSPLSAEPNRLAALDRVRREVMHCTLCHELAQNRTQTVFGTGNPNARLCFLGEAPGADEDRQGEPFVGAAGRLLDKIMQACTLKREEVYILNVLKCRPPGNRTPLPEETANCRDFFERQLAIIRPEFLCCLGAVASQTLLRTTQSLGRLRGRWHDYQGIRVMVTYHPAYLLRTPEKKRDTWEDMKMLLHAMGIELPSR
jgi:uracil-DNA glycosylase